MLKSVKVFPDHQESQNLQNVSKDKPVNRAAWKGGILAPNGQNMKHKV